MARLRDGILWLIIGCMGVSACADELEFAAGGRVELGAVIDGETVRLSTPEGEYVFARTDFKSVRLTDWPQREWAGRREAALRGGADARCAAALWALERGMVDEAVELIRAARATGESHAMASRLETVVLVLAEECADPDLGDMEALLRGRFQVERSPHLILWHQAEPEEARSRLAMLENVLAGFYLEFGRLGIPLDAPKRRLPMIWFAQKSAYLGYLDQEGAGAFRSTRGYHHPTRGLVACYDARSDEEQVRGRAEVTERRKELAELERRIERMPAGARLGLGIRGARQRALTAEEARSELARLRRDVDRQQLLLDQAWHRLDRATAAHELVHQLVHVSRLAPRYEYFPIWLHEGLAMQFEATRGGEWGGLGMKAGFRWADWRGGSGGGLAALLRDEGLQHGYQRDAYARAWGWVYYLRVHRPEAWVSLLDRLRTPDAADAEVKAGARERARRFLEALLPGSFIEWEREWRRVLIESDRGVETTREGVLEGATGGGGRPGDG